MREARQRDIAEALKKQHNDASHLAGETLPDSRQVYCMKIVTFFLQAGVPLQKLAHFCDLLEEMLFVLLTVDTCLTLSLLSWKRSRQESRMKYLVMHSQWYMMVLLGWVKLWQ